MEAQWRALFPDDPLLRDDFLAPPPRPAAPRSAGPPGADHIDEGTALLLPTLTFEASRAHLPSYLRTAAAPSPPPAPEHRRPVVTRFVPGPRPNASTTAAADAAAQAGPPALSVPPPQGPAVPPSAPGAAPADAGVPAAPSAPSTVTTTTTTPSTVTPTAAVGPLFPKHKPRITRFVPQPKPKPT